MNVSWVSLRSSLYGTYLKVVLRECLCRHLMDVVSFPGHSDLQNMGRKKIAITRLADERNRQVIASSRVHPPQTYDHLQYVDCKDFEVDVTVNCDHTIIT